MPANPAILKVRDNVMVYYPKLLRRLSKAAETGWGIMIADPPPLRGLGAHLDYLTECMNDVIKEQAYLDRLNEEIARQEEAD